MNAYFQFLGCGPLKFPLSLEPYIVILEQVEENMVSTFFYILVFDIFNILDNKYISLYSIIFVDIQAYIVLFSGSWFRLTLGGRVLLLGSVARATSYRQVC